LLSVSVSVPSEWSPVQGIPDEDWDCELVERSSTEPKVWGSNPYGRASLRAFGRV